MAKTHTQTHWHTHLHTRAHLQYALIFFSFYPLPLPLLALHFLPALRVVNLCAALLLVVAVADVVVVLKKFFSSMFGRRCCCCCFFALRCSSLDSLFLQIFFCRICCDDAVFFRRNKLGPGKQAGCCQCTGQNEEEEEEASRARAGHACNSATSVAAATICNLFVALNQ